MPSWAIAAWEGIFVVTKRAFIFPTSLTQEKKNEKTYNCTDQGVDIANRTILVQLDKLWHAYRTGSIITRRWVNYGGHRNRP